MKLENVWATWRAAAAALEKGQPRQALGALSALFAERQHIEPDLRAQVYFTYGVTLLTTGDAPQAQNVLYELQDEDGFGSPTYNPIGVAGEIANAHVLFEEWPQAVEQATRAIELGAQRGIPTPTARINRAIARRYLQQHDDARADLENAIENCVEHNEIVTAAIAAEQLARTYLAESQFGQAQPWIEIAREVYASMAPQHLKSLGELGERSQAPAKSPPPTIPALCARLRALLEGTSNYLPEDCLSIFDLDLYRFLHALKTSTPPCRAEILLTHPVRKELAAQAFPSPELLGNALMGEIECVQPQEHYPDALAESFLARALRIERGAFPSFRSLFDCSLEIQSRSPAEEVSVLRWDAPHPWPFGFASILGVLAELYRLGFLHVEQLSGKLGEQAASVTFAGLAVRTWPRPIQARYLGLGEFHTGKLAAPPHLVEDLTRGHLRNRAANIAGFKRIGYAAEQAEQMASSGLVSILASSIGPAGGGPIPTFGGIPLNEFSLVNPPLGGLSGLPRETLLPGFFLDSLYQTSFFAPKPAPVAYYGANNELFRDHFEAFRKPFTPVGSVRVKHYAIPVYEVDTREELQRMVDALPEFQGVRCFYRGQTSGYLFQRSTIANQILYGRDSVQEPSLLGAAPRRGYDYNKVHPLLQLLVQDRLYEINHGAGLAPAQFLEKWEPLYRDATAKWDVAVMALAQHYGIPTFGLDITRSIDVALWFATNRFTECPGGHYYRPMKATDWPEKPAYWPVVYFILPVLNSLKPSIVDIHELDDLGLKALRPTRQQGAFFMGADGINKNRLAETLVCLVRLRPGDWSAPFSYREMFPPVAEDPAYALMLRLKQRYSGGALGHFFREIVDYRDVEGSGQ